MKGTSRVRGEPADDHRGDAGQQCYAPALTHLALLPGATWSMKIAAPTPRGAPISNPQGGHDGAVEEKPACRTGPPWGRRRWGLHWVEKRLAGPSWVKAGRLSFQDEEEDEDDPRKQTEGQTSITVLAKLSVFFI